MVYFQVREKGEGWFVGHSAGGEMSQLSFIEPEVEKVRDWAPKSHAHRDDPETSHEAAKAAKSFVHAHIEKIKSAYRTHPKGLTAEECAGLIRLDTLQVMKRISDLRASGDMQHSGVCRRNKGGKRMTVWVLKGE